jgi:hypothetical protein
MPGLRLVDMPGLRLVDMPGLRLVEWVLGGGYNYPPGGSSGGSKGYCGGVRTVMYDADTRRSITEHIEDKKGKIPSFIALSICTICTCISCKQYISCSYITSLSLEIGSSVPTFPPTRQP